MSSPRQTPRSAGSLPERQARCASASPRPSSPVLAPHLIGQFTAQAPHVTVNLQRMWLPAMTDALVAGRLDVAITCGLIPAPEGIANEVFCAEPLLVGLRPGHRLAGQDTIALPRPGPRCARARHPRTCSPPGRCSQRQALDTAGISPPAVDLADTELAATRWADQRDMAWILLIPSLAAAHTATVIRAGCASASSCRSPCSGTPAGAHTTAVARFVHAALTAELPPGWHTQPDHLHHRE